MVLAIWLYLLLARGGFWLGRERDDGTAAGQGPWPSVMAVIPARDEAECVGDTVASLLRQDYPGAFRVILVDDQSRDGTAAGRARCGGRARRGGPPHGHCRPPLPAGLDRQALGPKRRASRRPQAAAQPPDYLLLTDADIVHAPDALRWLVAQARDSGNWC